ncbi:hypothetical protein AB0E08_07700 [Streptomyces sp. NPDC048281]|uniref:hypothetical protein n=1 Tax=Streptomyces sp. NPDC048281 TaxID=3154715 RepID=UPI0034464EDF
MSAELTELAELWATYARYIADAQAKHPRGIFLYKADGSGELLTIDEEGELRMAEFAAENLAWQHTTSAEQGVVMLRFLCKDAKEHPERPNAMLPPNHDRIRSLLTEAGLEAPEVHIWEVYTASDVDKKGA